MYVVNIVTGLTSCGLMTEFTSCGLITATIRQYRTCCAVIKQENNR